MDNTSKQTLKYSALLLLAALIWGFAFSFQALASSIGAFTFNALRTFLAIIAVLPVIIKFSGDLKPPQVIFMNFGLVGNTNSGYTGFGSGSGITGGKGALQSAQMNAEKSKFAELLDRMKAQNDGRGTVSSSQIAEKGRLNGDYTSGFGGAFSGENAKNARPTGAAANQANINIQQKTIDKTSELYEKSLELENYFVKQMLSSMRKTVLKSGESDFARDTYEDMMYDEYSTALTKNAGFGLADQIYLSLV